MIRKRLLPFFLTLVLVLVLLPAPAQAVSDGYYTLYGPNNEKLCQIGGTVYVGDEYISTDNQLYRIVEIDKATFSAYAEHLGEEPPLGAQTFSPMTVSAQKSDKGGLVGIYCTHSDEAYEDGDGTSSIEQGGGIYDVARLFSESLQELGVETKLDETNHCPHDAGAYRRSQPTAAQLAKEGAVALLDIHRDGIPDPNEYLGEVEGEPISMVRLLVGRQNANSAANREFAKLIKNTADEMYPGLIRDIFIGKGNYNQEIMPHSVLIEFGTYTLDKELVLKAAPYMANVVKVAVFGGSVDDGATATPNATNEAKATPGTGANVTPMPPSGSQQGNKAAVDSNKGAGTGIGWVIGLFVVGLVVVGLIIGGRSGLGGRLSRTMSEMTGGAIGRKAKDDDKLS